jgi:hypothetical protein
MQTFFKTVDCFSSKKTYIYLTIITVLFLNYDAKKQSWKEYDFKLYMYITNIVILIKRGRLGVISETSLLPTPTRSGMSGMYVLHHQGNKYLIPIWKIL